MDVNIYRGMMVGGFFIGVGNVFGQWLFNSYIKKKIIKYHKSDQLKTQPRTLLKTF